MIKGYTLFQDDSISQKGKCLLRVQCKRKALLPAVSSSRNNLLYLEENVVEKCKFHDFSFSHTISKKIQFLGLGNFESSYRVFGSFNTFAKFTSYFI